MQPLFAQQIESVLSSDETLAFLQICDELGLGTFLVQCPLSKISLVSQVLIDAKAVNGFYNYKTQELEISLFRTAQDFGHLYRKQRIWSISSLALNAKASIARTLVHELGHHLHRVLWDVDSTMFRQTMLIPTTDSLTQYGLLSAQEHFAETFAAFVFHRVELFMDDSLGYAMMTSVLARLGLEIKELL